MERSKQRLSGFSGVFRPKGFDPYCFVPRDKHDHESADRAMAAGYPAVEPVLWHLLEWIQDMNWPVAQTLAPFLASIGTPLVPHIKKVFETDDEMWKYSIMGEIFLASPEIAWMIVLTEETCILDENLNIEHPIQ